MNAYLISGVLFVVAYVTAWFDKPILAFCVASLAVTIAFFKYLDHPTNKG